MKFLIDNNFVRLLNFIKKNKWFFSILLLYLILRLINLTLLPIFNDESIYLDWGFRETHNPGFLYYSLYDSKQPLLMWFFGIFQNLFQDPLFAGRLVSVITGMFTLSGIYYFCKKYFNLKTAAISSLFYIFIPIFSFYDRQALMESAVAACGIWSGILFVEFIKKTDLKNSILLGFVLGIGFFIKSSALIFIAVFMLSCLIFLYKHKNKPQFVKSIFVVLLTFCSVTFLLLINPEFWLNLSKNSRYTLSLSELLSFPIVRWISNLFGNLVIGLFYLTPLVFATFFAGIIKSINEKKKEPIIILFFLGMSYLLSTFVTRVALDRYIVSFMPFACIFAGYFIYLVFRKNKYVGYVVLVVILLFPGILTLTQITNPPLYLQAMAKLANNSQLIYLQGVNSGYGINETVEFIKKQSSDTPLFVGIAENTGNPESAILVYFNQDKNIHVAYFDAKLLNINTGPYECLSLGVPFIFVSRYDQLAGLDKFLIKVKTINNPYGDNSIGIYQLKKNCRGKSLNLGLKKN